MFEPSQPRIDLIFHRQQSVIDLTGRGLDHHDDRLLRLTILLIKITIYFGLCIHMYIKSKPNELTNSSYNIITYKQILNTIVIRVVLLLTVLLPISIFCWTAFEHQAFVNFFETIDAIWILCFLISCPSMN